MKEFITETDGREKNSELRLIVGLGNPGKDYRYTRHNLGFLVVGHLAQNFRLKFQSSSLCKGLVAQGTIVERSCALLLPQTFMNHSGLAVKQFIEKKSLEQDQVLVVCDDFNLNFGEMRLRRKGSDGGHNGLKSVVECLSSKDFARLRLGIGYPRNKNDIVNYVLEEFKTDEKKKLDEFIRTAVDCCENWLTKSIEQVMEQFNRRQ